MQRFTVRALLVIMPVLITSQLWANGALADSLPSLPIEAMGGSSSLRLSDDAPSFDVDRSATASFSDDPSCCCCCCVEQQKLLRFIAPSEPCFTEFISPMTNPVYFENPRTLTEVRLLYLHHRVPLTALGGDVNLFAAQVRAALNERLSIIATKDGFITSTNPVIDDGWADINLGLKYNLFANPHTQRLLSVGVTYELPVGSTRAVQGNGGGMFNLFASGGMAIGQWHALSTSGLLLPADRTAESSIYYYSYHLSRRLAQTSLHFLGELNGYHYMGAGNVPFPLPIEGGDLFNIGSVGVAGNDIVTGAFGLRLKPSDALELGVAWEVPLTKRRDVLDNRLTVDCILRY
jgi:hypothetical protein